MMLRRSGRPGTLACLKTSPMSVSSLLGGFATLAVPQFQRAYAWEANEVDVFLRDVERCRIERRNGDSRGHFFGAIVSTSVEKPGSTRPHLILVDGQQRLATLFMFLAHLKARFDLAARLADTSGEEKLKNVFECRSELIECSFLHARDIDFGTPQKIRKLSLGKSDDDYFGSLIGTGTAETSRPSHRRLQQAFNKIGAYLDGLLEAATTPQEQDLVLDALYQTYITDWTIVHLSSDDPEHANLMFRVLNSRGVPVSEAELLRARTLEAVDGKVESKEFNRLAQTWDDILSANTPAPDIALLNIFESRTGLRPDTIRYDEAYEAQFFSELNNHGALTPTQAGLILDGAVTLEKELEALAALSVGEPPPKFATSPKFDALSKSKLVALVHVLKQDYCCLPLLLAAAHTGPGSFAEIADLVERFLFRYACIVRAPMRQARELFGIEAVKMREAGTSYSLKEFINCLQELLDNHANDALFSERLGSLQYGKTDNSLIRYALILVEHTWAWYNEGGQGKPIIRDRTRILDFSSITIEHIYAQSTEEKSAALEALKNSLGNLTILSKAENGKLGRKPFDEKKPIFNASNNAINRSIGKHDVWTPDTIRERQRELIQQCLSVFRAKP